MVPPTRVGAYWGCVVVPTTVGGVLIRDPEVQQAIERLLEGRTVFVIAHRLSTVRDANAILVIEDGRIIERGDHDDLLAQRGRYYELYMGQSELD